jgi:hypothetical protein
VRGERKGRLTEERERQGKTRGWGFCCVFFSFGLWRGINGISLFNYIWRAANGNCDFVGLENSHFLYYKKQIN